MKNYFTKLAAILLMASASSIANAQYEEIELGQTYTGFSLENPQYMQWTAPATGILTAKQRGTDDSMLYLDADFTHLFPSNGYTTSGLDLVLPYGVEEGETYYFSPVAYGMNDDGSRNYMVLLTRITFTFEEIEDTAAPIELGESYTLNFQSDAMKFVPEKSGLLTVQTNTWNYYLEFLYSNFTCTNPVRYMQTVDGTNGAAYIFEVTAGESYYLHTDSFDYITFTFESVGNPELVSLSMADPAPGRIITANYISGILVGFTPAAVSINNVYATYTPVGGTSTVSENLSYQYFRLDGAWQVGLEDRKLYQIANELAAPGSNVNIVLEGVNYNGIPVTVSDINNDYISIENGNVTLTYLVPSERLMLVEQTWPSVLYSSWPQGTPAEAYTATLVFNEDISYVGDASVTLGRQYFNSPGNSDSDDIDPFASLNPVINGNTVTIDFSNVELSANGYDTATVFIQGIMSESGQVYSEAGFEVLTKYLDYINKPYTGESGIYEIVENNGQAEYYNLQGIRVENPTKGSILIKVTNGKSSVVKY